jgi:hypothetical protein
MACPPEDSGGVRAYGEFVTAMVDTAHPEHAAVVEWFGGPFDPAKFIISDVNAQLRFVR